MAPTLHIAGFGAKFEQVHRERRMVSQRERRSESLPVGGETAASCYTYGGSGPNLITGKWPDCIRRSLDRAISSDCCRHIVYVALVGVLCLAE